MIEAGIFYLVAALLTGCAVMVVTLRGLFASALYLAAALSLVGALFAMLGADFLFAVQILLYVGGVLVIIAFAVMLTNSEQLKSEPQTNRQWGPALLLCLGLILMVLVGVRRHSFVSVPAEIGPTTKSMGFLLLGGQILPFEAVSLVLLASLLGAVMFSRKERGQTPAGSDPGKES
ncbi:MAG: hypothetical protein A3A86_03525 [Elusimicrobia bacterium RIFCSPLOWO2_01_FULL_60_11]|nr:MAG: hypothetical protein A3A86_03525 [Elusimicrobia bacterium RIFCSPLOWO2_01_FULL_60_11]